jgi:hypothetical protein
MARSTDLAAELVVSAGSASVRSVGTLASRGDVFPDSHRTHLNDAPEHRDETAPEIAVRPGLRRSRGSISCDELRQVMLRAPVSRVGSACGAVHSDETSRFTALSESVRTSLSLFGIGTPVHVPGGLLCPRMAELRVTSKEFWWARRPEVTEHC